MKRTSKFYTDATVSVVNYSTGAKTSVTPQVPVPSGVTPDAVAYIDTKQAGGIATVCSVTVDANAAKTFATGAIGTNQITLTAHGYKTGIVGQFTTDGGLPTGLSTSTNYYTSVVDANTVAFYDTQAHALAGGSTGKLTYTASGASGTGTFTPTSIAGASVTPQFSLDGTTWANVNSATSITVSTTYSFIQDRPVWPYFRLSFAVTAGSLTLATKYGLNFDGAGN